MTRIEDFASEFYQILKEESTSIVKIIQNIE